MSDSFQVKVDEDLKEIVDDYLKNIQEQIQILTEGLNNKAFDDISAIAHQMKGSGSSYGFDFITDWGVKLEQAARDVDLDSIKNCIQSLDNDLKKAEIIFVPEDEL